ncbi:MAG: hypothetical protein WC789_09340 [Lentisphaeria bacterium]
MLTSNQYGVESVETPRASGATGKEQPEDVVRLSKLCRAMVDSAKVVTDKWGDIYETAVRYLFNDQLRDKDRKEGWPAVQLNMLFPALTQEMAVLAQRKPEIEALPETGGDKSQGDQQAAEVWKGILKYDWERTLKMPKRCRQAVLDGKLHGYWLGYPYWDDRAYWDEDRSKWIGAPKVSVLSPRRFGMDPNAEDLEEAEFCYLQVERSVEWCLSQWPDKREIILRAASAQAEDIATNLPSSLTPPGQHKADSEIGKGIDETSTTDGMISGFILEARKRFIDTAPQDEEFGTTGRTLMVTGVWFKDRRTKKLRIDSPLPMEEVERLKVEGALSTNETGQLVVGDPSHEVWAGRPFAAGYPLSQADWPVDTREVDKPVFPRGRCVWLVDQEVLNPKTEDQVWRYSRWPFVVGVNAMLPHMWQGLNGVEMVRGIQDWINISATKLLNWLVNFADPALAIEEGALATRKTRSGEKAGILSRVAGAIWTFLPGKLRKGMVTYMPPPALPEGTLRLYELMHRVGQDATGVHNPGLGATSKGQPTATEIATLQTSTQTRQGLQIALLDEWVQQIMELVAEIRQVHMEEGDMARLLGEKGETQVSELTADAAQLRFDVRLKVGTALPFDDERQRQEAERLKAMFPQNPEVSKLVLERFRVDNVDEIMQADALYSQFLAWLEQMQAAQAAEAQQGPPGGQALPPAA